MIRGRYNPFNLAAFNAKLDQLKQELSRLQQESQEAE